jgi:hypothetical protein
MLCPQPICPSMHGPSLFLSAPSGLGLEEDRGAKRRHLGAPMTAGENTCVACVAGKNTWHEVFDCLVDCLLPQ